MNAMRSARTAVSLPIRLVSAMVLLGGIAIAGDAMATTYRIVLLPLPAPPPGGTGGARALDINSTGEIVGQYYFTDSSGFGGNYAVAWSPPDYAVRALPPSSEGVNAMLASRVSDDGDIIGTAAFLSVFGNGAVLWEPSASSGVYMAPADGHSIVADINASGIAVGQIGPLGEFALWTDPSTYTVLSVPDYTDPYAINDSEVVVGTVGSGLQYAFKWTLDGGVQDLGDLPGGKKQSVAYDVNNSGQIVGYGYSQSGRRALLWDVDGTMHDLGDIPGSRLTEHYATRINNVGQVIGSSSNRRGVDNSRGDWLWIAGTGMQSINSVIDPNDPLYNAGVIRVYSLNDAGMLVGSFSPLRRGSQSGVLLIPQP